MILKKYEDLSKHVTIRIGGVAEFFYIPENIEELQSLVREKRDFLILSGGSNLLIDDRCIFPCVISMKRCCLDITRLEGNQVYVGSSVRIQKFICEMIKSELGGIEFLYSLPALFGGIVYMNAGTGLDRKCISDYIVSVKYLNERGEICEIKQSDCDFCYRKSVFQKKKWIILGAVLELNCVTEKQSQEAINSRLEHCKKSQDMRYPNFGSLFCQSSYRIMQLLQQFSRCENGKKGACLSSRSTNWLVNRGDGTFKQVIKIIKRITWLHILAKKKCEVEIRIWKQ